MTPTKTFKPLHCWCQVDEDGTTAPYWMHSTKEQAAIIAKAYGNTVRAVTVIDGHQKPVTDEQCADASNSMYEVNARFEQIQALTPPEQSS